VSTLANAMDVLRLIARLRRDINPLSLASKQAELCDYGFIKGFVMTGG